MSGDGTLIAQGVKQGITEKSNGWFEIAVGLPGKDYPLKISTKKQELVELARAAGENVMEWYYTEQDSGTPNPHRPGSNYINRYFEGVAPVGTAAPQPTTEAQIAVARVEGSRKPQNASDAMSKEEWARKDSAIHKMACIKTAADALKHTLPSDPSAQDLSQFLTRVSTLSLAWHRSVIAERDDPTGEAVPFD